MAKTFLTADVFTPTSPAKWTYIERTAQERQFKRALRTKGKQIIVYGHTGSGKTTMLNSLLAEMSVNHITTRCTRGISISNVLFDAFDQLGGYYIEKKEEGNEDKVSGGLKFGIEFFSFQLGGESKDIQKEIRTRIVEVQKNPNQLAKLFGNAGMVWIIEDFHKLDAGPKKELSQIMKVFMDVAEDFPKLKIIAIGAVESARQVVHYDKEMENRISEVNVPLIEPEDLAKIIQLGEGYLNITFEQSVIEKIVAYSSGLASVTHQLCSLSCESKNIEKTQIKSLKITEDDLEYAISEYVNEKSDSLKSTYEQAIKIKTKRKIETPERILEAILRLEKDSFTVLEVIAQIAIKEKDYKGNNLRKYMMELTSPERGEILRYNRNADTFSFSNPFLRGYSHIHLIKYPKNKRTTLDKEYQNADLLRQYLNEEYKKFLREFQDIYFDTEN
jgi:Holliday junction resolvasome RuvABC ATP-dependent DNA helicase subunit